VQPGEDTSDEGTIDRQKPDWTSSPEGTKTRARRQVIGVDTAVGKVYSNATGLYNNHQKYSEQ
jgi:hypothetical protein